MSANSITYIRMDTFKQTLQGLNRLSIQVAVFSQDLKSSLPFSNCFKSFLLKPANSEQIFR